MPREQGVGHYRPLCREGRTRVPDDAGAGLAPRRPWPADVAVVLDDHSGLAVQLLRHPESVDTGPTRTRVSMSSLSDLVVSPADGGDRITARASGTCALNGH